MTKHKFKTLYDRSNLKATSEKVEEKSLTVQNKSIHPRDLLRSLGRGETIEQSAGYNDFEGMEFPDFLKMDKIDKLRWSRSLQNKILEGNEKLEALQKTILEYEKEQAESKEASDTNETE